MNLFDDNLWKQFIQWLEARYYNPDTGEWGRNVGYDDYINSRYDFGSSYNLCMAIMGVLQEAGHRVAITGAEASAMEPYRPTSIGLDWLLVDDRYIIDPWGFSYEAKPKIVYDLHSLSDTKLATTLFPPQKSWEPGRPNEEFIDIGVKAFNQFMMPRRAVDTLLKDETEP